MKTKIKILIVSCVIAAAAVTGFNLAQNSNNMNVTLADIAVMARAGGESGGLCFLAQNVDRFIWDECEETWTMTGDCWVDYPGAWMNYCERYVQVWEVDNCTSEMDLVYSEHHTICG